MTLMELVSKEIIWKKEKISIKIDNKIVSKIDRIEFIMYDYEDLKVIGIEPDIGIYNNESIPILIIELESED